MAKRTINELFDEFEAFIEDCKVQTFSSNRLVVPRDELFNRIREIRMKLPSEVEKSTQLMGKRDQILKDAHDRAEQIKIVAQEEAQRRIGETEVMKQAMEQAKILINQANLKAQEIINDAVEESNTIRVGALNYTNNVMIDLSDFTASILNEEGMKFQQLVDTMKAQYDVIEANRKQITAQLQSGVVPQDDGESGAVTQHPTAPANQPTVRPAAPRVAEQDSAAVQRTTVSNNASDSAAAPTGRVAASAAPTPAGRPTASVASTPTGRPTASTPTGRVAASTVPTSAGRPAASTPTGRAAAPTPMGRPAASTPPSQPINPPKKPMTSEDMPVEDELDELDELYLDQY